MKKLAVILFIFLFASGLCLGNDMWMDIWADSWSIPLIEALPPLDPVFPGGTGTDAPGIPLPPSGPADFFDFPALPAFPLPPGSSTSSRAYDPGPVREIEKQELIVTEAFPNGDSRRNTADTIGGARYILYSDATIAIELDFTGSLRYIYHLSNARQRIETGPGIFRVTYDTSIQAGREILLGQYTSELFSNADHIISANIFSNNAIIVILNFSIAP